LLTIKCAKCKTKIFRYLKIGKGRVLHCWKGRIVKDFSVREGDLVKCPCGNIIGIDQGKWINMKQRAFIHTGMKEK